MVKKFAKNYGQILLRGSFWFGILGIFILYSIDSDLPMFWSQYEWNVAMENDDVMYYITGFILFGSYKVFMLVFATVGFGLQFSDEWNHGMAPQIIRKWGIKKYACTYTALGALSGGMISSLGMGVYILYMHSRLQLINKVSLANEEGWNYLYAVNDKNGVGYMLIIIGVMFVAGAIASVMALCFSTVTTNKYIVMIFPYLVYRTYVEIAKAVSIPNKMRIDYYLLGRNDIGTSYLSTAVILIVILAAVILTGQFLFRKGIRRKLCYEKY